MEEFKIELRGDEEFIINERKGYLVRVIPPNKQPQPEEYSIVKNVVIGVPCPVFDEKPLLGIKENSHFDFEFIGNRNIYDSEGSLNVFGEWKEALFFYFEEKWGVVPSAFLIHDCDIA